ncbi:MAG: glycosyltransferase family 87 protein [Myxococcota bacterium]
MLVAAFLWHFLAIAAPPLQPPKAGSEGRDYASYHYAAQTAAAGEDPWALDRVEAVAQADGTRTWVHPYLYPPPFLLLVWPLSLLSLGTAFVAWGVLQEIALIAAALALAWGWRSVHGAVGVVFVALAALMYGLAYGFELGQANVLVLALVLGGAALQDDRPVLGGVMLGLACMLKMSPALVVLWWLLRGRTQSVVAAVAAAVGISILVLPLVGPAEQLGFYTGVLPRFGSGDYNGLTIRIGIFGNHSIPSLLHAWTTEDVGVRTLLTPLAKGLSALTTLGLLGGLGVAFRPRPGATHDAMTTAGQLATVLVLMILVPVYTYEHHLVFALPAMSLALVALHLGRLPLGWAVPIGMAVAVLCVPLPTLKGFADEVITKDAEFAYGAVREAKTVALLTVGAATAWLGRGQGTSAGRNSPGR